jgi:hypothetical protein
MQGVILAEAVQSLLLVTVVRLSGEGAGQRGLAEGPFLEDGVREPSEVALAGPPQSGEGGVDPAEHFLLGLSYQF